MCIVTSRCSEVCWRDYVCEDNYVTFVTGDMIVKGLECACAFKKTWRIIKNLNFSLKHDFIICKTINLPI